MSAPAPAGGAPVTDDRDYLDKGLDAGLKKYGGAKFQDPNANRATKEKITDFCRKQFEKITGYDSPPRYRINFGETCFRGLTHPWGSNRKKVPAKISN